jgi:F420-non-reducing hydrogenase iron-sulfur subunit
MGAGLEFKPRIVGFLCNWCCYGGADLCGVSRFQYPPHLRVIRLMCSGRVDLSFILRAFSNGADGVFIGGCHLNDCHYNTEGNYDALNVMHLCKKVLEHIGVNPGRLRLEWVSAGEGIRFAEVMNDFSKQIKTLGPLGKSEGMDQNDVKSRIAEITKLVPYLKMVCQDKLASRLKTPEDYEGLFTHDEIERLFREVVSYYIDPTKCQACSTCLKKCPAKAIVGGKNRIHVIDQEKCMRCGTCFEACPPRFGSVRKISGEPVPPPIPEEARTIVRKGKAARSLDVADAGVRGFR